jgi:hypothetical protein
MSRNSGFRKALFLASLAGVLVGGGAAAASAIAAAPRADEAPTAGWECDGISDCESGSFSCKLSCPKDAKTCSCTNS